MKIAVCIKQVPDTTKVDVDEKTGVLKRDGIETKINPYDLYALETALKLKEEKGGEVISISMGPPQAKEIIRESYMMGVDQGYLVSDRAFAGADVLATCYTLSQAIEVIGVPDLILCGKQTTDGDTAQVGASLAEMLDIPSVCNVTKILETTDSYIRVEVDMGDTVETMDIMFPCLISVEKGGVVPRLPSYLKKMETKNREVTMLTLQSMKDQNPNNYGLNASPTQVERIFPPEANSDRQMYEGSSQELADIIHDILKDNKFI